MEDEIIAIYCFIDDVLKSMNHPEDKRRKVSDSEILTTAIVSGKYFYGHQHRALSYMKSSGLMPTVLEKSRFNRRLHKVAALFYKLFSVITEYIKYIRCDMQYIIDSFPVALCDNIRIQSSKIVKGNSWRGYTASMRRYFYGIKVQLIVNDKGIPVQFHFVTGKTADGKNVEDILQQLQPEATVYADSAYNNYQAEDNLMSNHSIVLQAQRKSNSKRTDTKEQMQHKLKMRKRVEATICNIKKLFPRTIHAVTLNGFLIKLCRFICVEQFKHFF